MGLSPEGPVPLIFTQPKHNSPDLKARQEGQSPFGDSPLQNGLQGLPYILK